jgi:glycosyl hydrolase family 17
VKEGVDLSNDILPAIKNLHSALIEVGIKKIQVSTTFSIVPLLNSAFPPSSAEFAEPINDVIIKPLLDFLNEANSSLLVNVYPYELFRLTNDLPFSRMAILLMVVFGMKIYPLL